MQHTPELWRLHMQRRVLRLLSQYDEQLFHSKFRVFFAESRLPRLPLLQQYDRYIRLLLLSEELLDDILPRLRRQLSLQDTVVYRQEEVPTQGEIDWSRTLQRSLRNLPDQPPLRFDTRQQQRSFANPENTLVIAILLNYQSVLKSVLNEDLADEALSTQERQTLIHAEERIERELVTFHSIREEAGYVDIEALATYVGLHLRPGLNPYRDLLAWWEQFHNLHINAIMPTAYSSLMRRRADEQQDTWLYELWFSLELLHMLWQQQALDTDSLNITVDAMNCLFTWQGRRFRFCYQRRLSTLEGHLEVWNHAPALSAAYVIEREKPLTIAPQETIIWREPPCIISAYFPLTERKVLSLRHPKNELLGDMQLLGTTQGILCMPSLSEDEEAQEYVRTMSPRSHIYHVGTIQEARIGLYALTPGMELDKLHERLEEMLNLVVMSLPERTVACHGIYLDEETVNQSRSTPRQYNIMCPKPHIGNGVFDLVHDQVHCLKDARFCHVLGQPVVPPFVIRTSTLNELSHKSGDIRTRTNATLKQAEDESDESKAEQLRNHIFLGVGRAIEQYVQLKGNTKNLEENYEEWIFGLYWKQHSHSLAESTRRILLSAAFVWNEYGQTSLDDWAAPAIQYCRALEAEIKRRLQDYYPDAKQQGFRVPNNHMTLGALEYIYKNKGKNVQQTKNPKEAQNIQDSIHNWSLCLSLVQQASASSQDFATTIARMESEHVAVYRNQLAHGGPVAKSIAQSLRETIIGRRDKLGILPWFAEHLPPKQ